MEWIFKPDIPIYLQIVEHMKIRIARGELKIGEKLNSVRELAIDAGVNPNTMQRALQEMEKDGLLYSERTSGRFVTKDQKVLDGLRDDLSHQFVSDLFKNLKKMGMEKKEILEVITAWKEEETK